MIKRNRAKKFVICVYNENGEADLEVRKVYEVLPDRSAERHHHLRIVDESGEDYLYPSEYFLPIDLPKSIEEALEASAELQTA